MFDTLGLTTTLLAGLADGTSNGSIGSLVGKILAACTVIGVGAFAALALVRAYGKPRSTGRFASGGGRESPTGSLKQVMPVIGCFVIFIVLVAGVWGLVQWSGALSGGLFG
ncbi:hypothetical protein P3F83_07750 [Mycobacteroides immunogenum]|uniref:hypothetical protein n=1 Tax=Mycobacteroides immunogenum TaxID=83262 RepID=UPI0025B763E0|nr:hypothetical protein [Mycobacteroides immunogenum]WJR35254.1 hypothetical protein P3F83_07750 [Mycobacteroides immunogenum]